MPIAEAEKLLRGPIVKGVGKGKKNLALDVALVQSLLNTIKSLSDAKTKKHKTAKPTISKLVKAADRLAVNGKNSVKMVNEIEAFQGLYCSFKPDGKISPNKTTWKTLLEVSGIKVTKKNKLEVIFGKAAIKHTAVLKAVNKAELKAYISGHLYLNNSKEKVTEFLTSMLSDKTVNNVYWAAYYLATAYHETTFSLAPIREEGLGKGRKYDKKIKVKDTYGYRGKKDKEYTNVFYGRGYVQITHGTGYKNISKLIGLKEDELYINPDRALEVGVAYKILTFWMQNDIHKIKGVGRKIQEHLTAAGPPKYVAARKIVNGVDKANLIATYAIVIEALIRLSARK